MKSCGMQLGCAAQILAEKQQLEVRLRHLFYLARALSVETLRVDPLRHIFATGLSRPRHGAISRIMAFAPG
jgi:hypothetical protein